MVDPPETVTITPGGSDEDMGAPSTAIGGDGFTNHEAIVTVLRKTGTVRDSTSGSRSTDFKMARSALTLKTA